jgi:CPA2 family monovalent cation:H+ antiporter-2
MDSSVVTKLVLDLLLILLAGLTAGIVCKRLGISLLVGYLVVGALLGHGGIGLIGSETRELKYLAETGALLLLFSIGLEFSLGELVRMSRFFFVGGTLQMLLVAGPAMAVGMLRGLAWGPAALVGAATALSSTVLVYKALEEYGQTETPHGRRAIATLLFQDVALVPLILLVPMLTGAGGATAREWIALAVKSAMFVATVVLLRYAVSLVMVPLLASLRSTELVVLFSLTVLGGAGIGAYAFGLPPALGAFAAGLVLAGGRLTAQIDALVLPYRETFAAVFFVSLGSLMRFNVLVEHPVLCLAGLAAVIALKTVMGTVSLRVIGLPWRAAAGMGLGLAQLGEFSFLLLSAGVAAKVIDPYWFHLMLFLALGTLILTPPLIKLGLQWTDPLLETELEGFVFDAAAMSSVRRAVVVGMGPIGAQVASRLETGGVAVCLVDLSPVNLHAYAQEGFPTVAGDATDPDVLRRAAVAQCSLVVVTVPKDQTAKQTVAAVRRLNRTCQILVRCRYRVNVAALKQAGADAVISEEAEASAGLLRLLGEG